MATIFQVWGKPPPSVWNALTPRQRQSLNRYISLKIVKPCYRLAYDHGRDAGLDAPKKKRKARP